MKGRIRTGDRSIRLAVSAHDVGSASQNRAFIEHCRQAGAAVAAICFASENAYPILAAAGCPAYMLDGNAPDAHGQVREALDAFNADFYLVGLTVNPNNIDDLLRDEALARRKPSGCIQDYWGYTGSFRGERLPDVFFVLDQEAARLTAGKTHGRASCVVTGSPKHDSKWYARHGLRNRQPEALRVTPRLTFFAQPLWIPGFVQNLQIFIDAVNTLDAPVELAITPHPADSGKLAEYRGLLGRSRKAWRLVDAEEVSRELLVESECVATCFSTVGIDHNYLQAASPWPLGSLLYVTIGDSIRDFMDEQIGTPDIPGVAAGLGEQLKSVAELRASLELGYGERGRRERYWNAARQALRPCGASDAVYGHILQAIESPCVR